MRAAVLAAVLTASPIQGLGAQAEPSHIAFPTGDGGRIHADLYGRGTRGVVLAHGGRFDKGSWGPQARQLEEAGYRVLALDFRGYGASTGPGQEDPLSAPLHLDVLGAVRYLRTIGVETVAVVGGSMGGAAAADAAIEAEPGEIDALVILAATAKGPPEQIKGRKLFVVAQGDTTAAGIPRLEAIRDQFDRAADPKELLVLDGAAHAQFLFESDQGERLIREILRFLSSP
ncbi:MAG TPA: alpha/beta fold hydrolase [Gemmatimonadales bacterium]